MISTCYNYINRCAYKDILIWSKKLNVIAIIIIIIIIIIITGSNCLMANHKPIRV